MEWQRFKMKRQVPSLVLNGFRLAWRNWPFVLWAYAVNLAFGLLAGVSFSAGVAGILDHSLAAQQIAGSLDASYLMELALHLGKNHMPLVAGSGALALSSMEFLVIFFLMTGSVQVFITGERPTLGALLRGGAEYFWRFVRISLFAAVVAVPVLGGMIAARAFLLRRAAAVYVERAMFFRSIGSGAIILLVALFLRLWLDLIEVYTVQRGITGDPRIRKTLLPALRLGFQYFFRLGGAFLLAGMAGASALIGCIYLWKDLVAPNRIWLAFLLSQLGIFLLWAARFWQRGMEAALLLAADPPLAADLPEFSDEPELSVAGEADALADAAPVAAKPTFEPTLAELVRKLQTEPWAKPNAGTPSNSDLFPEVPPPAQSSAWPALLVEHEGKTPIPGWTPKVSAEDASAAEPAEQKDQKEQADKKEQKDNPPASETRQL